MNKKAQAAMEFLMTYGWAILVVLAAIGALAYFGVLSPDSFLPEQCIIVPGISCLDFNVESSGITLLISNSMGRDITVNQVSAGNCSNTLNQSMSNGAEFTFSLTGCDNGASGDKFKEDLVISYTSDTGFSKSVSGSITGKVG